MKIRRIRLMNYKSVTDSGIVEMHPVMSVLAGKNNVGKTALIEGIWRFFQDPYTGPGFTGSGGTAIIQQTPARLELEIELVEEDPMSIYLHDKGIVNRLFSLSLSDVHGQAILERASIAPLHSSDGTLVKRAARDWTFGDNKVTDIGQALEQAFTELKQAIMFISWRRSVRQSETIASQSKLDSSAGNLNSLLLSLHNNDETAFDRINATFREIFPEIEIVETRLIGQETSIMLRFTGTRTPIPLYECGSGLTQALVMLCILFAESSRLVFFDEPHACLHPSAEKAIYDLVAAQNDHQFVFTTHSSVLINYPAPKSLYLVTKERGQSTYTPLVEMDKAFLEVGLTNSDFAFADRVLFVEGDTEGQVLPAILDHYGVKQFGYNYRLINMGGVDGKGPMRRRLLRYQQVLSSISAVPIPHCLILDRDGKEEGDVAELGRLLKGNLFMLQRREIENYLLYPEAICEALKGAGVEPDIARVRRLVQESTEDTDNKDFYPGGCKDPVKDIKASAVIEKAFDYFSCPYNKPQAGSAMVKWVLDNGGGDLEEVFDLIAPFVKA